MAKRDDGGRWDFDGGMERLCRCGHELGDHSAGGKRDCIFYSLSAQEREGRPGASRKDCGCIHFRPVKISGK